MGTELLIRCRKVILSPLSNFAVAYQKISWLIRLHNFYENPQVREAFIILHTYIM